MHSNTPNVNQLVFMTLFVIASLLKPHFSGQAGSEDYPPLEIFPTSSIYIGHSMVINFPGTLVPFHNLNGTNY